MEVKHKQERCNSSRLCDYLQVTVLFLSSCFTGDLGDVSKAANLGDVLVIIWIFWFCLYALLFLFAGSVVQCFCTFFLMSVQWFDEHIWAFGSARSDFEFCLGKLASWRWRSDIFWILLSVLHFLFLSLLLFLFSSLLFHLNGVYGVKMIKPHKMENKIHIHYLTVI